MSEATYTVAEDYYEPLADGSGKRLIFKAGAAIGWDTAYALGLVKTKRPPAETEKAGKK